MTKILINTSFEKQVRVAILDHSKLLDFEIEDNSNITRVDNIYIGIVKRVEPSIDGAFIDYGFEKLGFINFRNIDESYLNADKKLDPETKVLVQVVIDERGHKGAVLTTKLIVQGNYTLIRAFSNPSNELINFSKGLEPEVADAIRKNINDLTIDKQHSVTIRTSARNHIEDVKEDIKFSFKLLDKLFKTLKETDKPELLIGQDKLSHRFLKSRMNENLSEVLIDNEDEYQSVLKFVKFVMPEHLNIIKLYSEPEPIFSKFQIEKKLITAYQRKVTLPSGGDIVIDTTEAMHTIDVNSSKSKGDKNGQATALNTNIEAAAEIARQIRFRNLGGLCVVDFIDMDKVEDQMKVKKQLQASLKTYRAQVTMTDISKLGLLEMSIQRIKMSHSYLAQSVCPTCDGNGYIFNVETLATFILRNIEIEVLRGKKEHLRVYVESKCATFLFNEYHKKIEQIRQLANTDIFIIPHANLQFPHFFIKRIPINPNNNTVTTSYDQSDYNKVSEIDVEKRVLEQTPLLKNKVKRPKSKYNSWLSRLKRLLFGKPQSKNAKNRPHSQQRKKGKGQKNTNQHNRNRNRRTRVKTSD